MQRRIGPLLAEVVEAESAKFTAPVLLLHGLWSTATIWRPFMGYLAHRGWRCIAPQLRADVAGREAISFAGQVDAVRRLVAGLDAPPVIVGHDLGALYAFQVAGAAAVAALAPLVLRPLAAMAPPVLFDADTWLNRLRAHAIPAPRGRWRDAYPIGAHAAREPAALIRMLREQAVDVPAEPLPAASLVIIGERDAITTVALARTLADHVGAELTVQPDAGHALLVDPGWEQRVSALHRWLIQRLGRPLLALYDESWDDT